VTGTRSTSDGARAACDLDAPTLLVAGGARVDAGKTTFSTGLVAVLSGDGEGSAAVPPTTGDTAADGRTDADAIGVKPRAGNDYWFDHDDVRVATDASRLYGKDARRLAAASTRPLDPRREAITPESINPVHRLWRPTPGRTGMLGETDRTFLCDRVTTVDGSRFVVNAVAEAEGLLPDGLSARLPLSDATRVDDVPSFNEVMASTYLPAFERLVDRVAGASVPVVIESYADVASPLSAESGGMNDVDAVAVVDPGRARIYAGDRYAKACRVASGSAREGTLEERTGAVTEMLDPLSTVGLPALRGEDRSRPKTIATRYKQAYDALLDAV